MLVAAAHEHELRQLRVIHQSGIRHDLHLALWAQVRAARAWASAGTWSSEGLAPLLLRFIPERLCWALLEYAPTRCFPEAPKVH